jgi:hypothetical protein
VIFAGLHGRGPSLCGHRNIDVFHHADIIDGSGLSS